LVWGFLADRNRNGSEKVFALTETEALSEGFWRLGVFGGFWQLGVFGGFWGFWPKIWQKCVKIGCFWQ